VVYRNPQENAKDMVFPYLVKTLEELNFIGRLLYMWRYSDGDG